jgi:hypothetical protein
MKIKFQSLIVGRVALSVFRGAYTGTARQCRCRDQLLMQFILKLVGLDTADRHRLLDQRIIL